MGRKENLRHYAHVVNNVVVNISVWDGIQPYTPAPGVEMVPLPFTEDETGTRRYVGGIGWDYLDGEFIDNRPAADEE